MKSSSPESRVVRAGSPDLVGAAGTRGDLRTGQWTRLGGRAVLGDAATERTLESLAERTSRAARAQGYARGWAEGRRAAAEAAAAVEAEDAAQRAAAREAWQRDRARTVGALEEAARDLRSRLDEACAAVEARVVDAALALAEAVVGRELAVASAPGADAVRRALTVLPHDVTVFTLRLHPDDAAELDATTFDGLAVTVVADPGVARGDAVAETGTMVIDASVDAALQRVREVLAP